MISSLLIPLLLFAFAGLLITAALSPIETLSWWAGWTEEEIDDHEADATVRIHAKDSSEKLYVVYLSGIASISGNFLIPREKAFIKSLKQNLPQAVIIEDVFPYSPTGLHLPAAPRFFDRMWSRIQKLKLEGRSSALSILINMRNVFQVMISADHRYGPIYNQGAANVIQSALLQAGYRAGGGERVAIIGYSGGAQIAIGAATFLKARLNTPIDVISIGGVMASDPGLHFVRKLHHIIGDGDNVRKIGAVMFPERWEAMGYSEWNVAKRDGRIERHIMPAMFHAGPRGYFGLPKIEGVSNNQRTLTKVVQLLSA